ncbi:hypothetical protein ACGYKD_18135 [Sulfitobacter sp. TB366]|uniref:hypothetical protein n=1 Tax=unclassified Sulfitobacter TaxID=196795 RepID=UPI003745E7B7
MNQSLTDIIKQAETKQVEAATYIGQLHTWLGVASASGVVALASFAGETPNPDDTLARLIPSFLCFFLGIVTVAFAVLARAQSASYQGWHLANAHNRQAVNEALAEKPEAIASPKSLAERLNAERSLWLAASSAYHEEAERTWRIHRRWRYAWFTSLFISALGFILGFAWPLYLVARTPDGLVL